MAQGERELHQARCQRLAEKVSSEVQDEVRAQNYQTKGISSRSECVSFFVTKFLLASQAAPDSVAVKFFSSVPTRSACVCSEICLIDGFSSRFC